MEYDKKLHLACGFAISLIIGLYNIYYGFIASVVAGAIKELYDYYHKDKHTVEFLDFVCTCLGGAIASSIFVAYYLATK